MKNNLFVTLFFIFSYSSIAQVGVDTLVDPRDGKIYKTVKIGTQLWMAENLNYACDFGYCYEDKIQNCDVYGRLYAWVGAKKACPSGWHIPDNSEWKILFNYLGGLKLASGKLKQNSSAYWHDDKFYDDCKERKPNNQSGFSAIPAGRYLFGRWDGLLDYNNRTIGYSSFWSHDETNPNVIELDEMTPVDLPEIRINSLNLKNLIGYGYSVRCIHDK